MHFDAVYPERSRGAQCKQKGSAALFLLIATFLIVVLVSTGLFLGLFKLPVLSPPVKVTGPAPIPVLVQTQTPALIPAPTPVPNLQLFTYNDQKLGLEFQYLKSLTAKEDSEEEFNQRAAGSASKSVNGDFRKNFKGYVGYEPGKFLGAVAVLDKDQNFDNNLISIWVFDNPDNLTVDAWFSKYWYYPFLWGVFDNTSKGHVTPDKEATISGQPAKSKIVSYQPGAPKYIYISSGGKMFLLRVLTAKENVGDQILSTFKFTN